MSSSNSKTRPYPYSDESDEVKTKHRKNNPDILNVHKTKFEITMPPFSKPNILAEFSTVYTYYIYA